MSWSWRAQRARTAAAEVVFRVAASPRIGFGHLVRAIHLASALGVPPRVSIRGTVDADGDSPPSRRRRAAARSRDAVRAPDLALLVIDDPSRAAATPWLRAARRAGVPVASLHDVGIAPLASDLAIDGSLGARRVDGLGVDAAACRLGPAYAVLPPARALAPPRAARERVPSEPPTCWSASAAGSRRGAGAEHRPTICRGARIAFPG